MTAEFLLGSQTSRKILLPPNKTMGAQNDLGQQNKLLGGDRGLSTPCVYQQPGAFLSMSEGHATRSWQRARNLEGGHLPVFHAPFPSLPHPTVISCLRSVNTFLRQPFDMSTYMSVHARLFMCMRMFMNVCVPVYM